MHRPGGPPSQRRPGPQHAHPPYSQHPPHSQHGQYPPHSHQPHSHQPHSHQPFTPQEANALLVDLAGAAAAATLMLVLTCWLLSLGGAFAPGHVAAHAPAAKAVAQPAAGH